LHEFSQDKEVPGFSPQRSGEGNHVSKDLPLG
jgi:hypothetical protein